jgi:hypothetical protein
MKIETKFDIGQVSEDDGIYSFRISAIGYHHKTVMYGSNINDLNYYEHELYANSRDAEEAIKP